jgi:hypothetical protein
MREVDDGGTKKRAPLKGRRGWILISGTLFHFERIEAPTAVTVAHAVSLLPIQPIPWLLSFQ